VRWHYRDAGLLWLFVPAYLIHLAEEWFGGFPAWVALIVERPVPETAFVAINAVALMLVIIGLRAATQAEANGWIAVAVATIVLVNTFFHLVGAALTSSYSPGVISAVVLYVPLGSLTMIRALDQSSRAQLARGIQIGVVIHAIVFIVAFASTRA